MNTQKSNLRINIILNFLYQFFLIVTPLITAPYVSRTLGPDGIGIYSYSNSLVTYFTIIAAVGTVSYGTRTIARSREDISEYSKKFWEIELLTVITSFISLGCWLILAFCYKEYEIYLLIMSFQILSVCFDISWLYAGLEKFKYTISVNFLTKLLGIVSIFLFVKTRNDLVVYVFIMVAVHFFGNISMWIFLPKTVKRAHIEKESLKHHFKETLIYFIPSIATVLYSVLDKSLIGILVKGYVNETNGNTTVTKRISNIENGYYEQATNIITMIKTVCFVAINGVVTSRASYLYKKHRENDVKELAKKTLGITLFLSIGACFGLIAISDKFVPLFFGDGFEKTTTLLYVFASIIPVICISSVLGSLYYTPIGKRKQSSIFVVAGMLFNLILSIPLILVMKSVGAAIASVVAEIVITILYFSKSNKFITLKWLLKTVYLKIIFGLTMCAAVYFLNHYLISVISEVASLFISVLAGLLFYAGMLLLVKDESVINLIQNIKDHIIKKNEK